MEPQDVISEFMFLKLTSNRFKLLLESKKHKTIIQNGWQMFQSRDRDVKWLNTDRNKKIPPSNHGKEGFFLRLI